MYSNFNMLKYVKLLLIIIPNKQTTWYALPSKGHIFHYVFVFRYLSSFFEHIIMDQKLENSAIMCCTIISKFKINIFLHSAGPRLHSLAFDACKIGIFFDECASFLVQIVPLLCNILCYIASLSHCLLEGFTVSIFHIRDKDKNIPQLWHAIMG